MTRGVCRAGSPPRLCRGHRGRHRLACGWRSPWDSRVRPAWARRVRLLATVQRRDSWRLALPVRPAPASRVARQRRARPSRGRAVRATSGQTQASGAAAAVAAVRLERPPHRRRPRSEPSGRRSARELARTPQARASSGLAHALPARELPARALARSRARGSALRTATDAPMTRPASPPRQRPR